MEQDHEYEIATQGRIAGYRRELQDQRDSYVTAQAMLTATPMAATMRHELMALSDIAHSVHADSAPSMALYVVAQLTYRLDQLLAPWRVVDRYKALQERIRLLEE